MDFLSVFPLKQSETKRYRAAMNLSPQSGTIASMFNKPIKPRH
jgi:hypothetical protein